MNSYIQLLCLAVSFLYGIFLYFANQFNVKVISNKNILLKIFISLLYVFNISLLYVCFLYKINGGILHVYFVLLIILGFVLTCVKKRK